MRAVAPLRARGEGGLAGALLAGDEGAAEALIASGVDDGALHIVAKRGDARLVRWLLDRVADPNARWNHWGATPTPLHLAAQQGVVEIARLLPAAGADPTIRDTLHDGDAAGWAEHGRVPPAPAWREVVALLTLDGAQQQVQLGKCSGQVWRTCWRRRKSEWGRIRGPIRKPMGNVDPPATSAFRHRS